MSKDAPIIIGGNGHSGTRVFAEIAMLCGYSMGVSGYSYSRDSKDLNIRRLMNRWMKPYLLGLDDKQAKSMQNQFLFWLRVLIPFRSTPWGFKNPRSMFLLPFYHELFPAMKFIHVIRDGRDMCFGNPFVATPTIWSFVSDEEAARLTPERRMMRFWGESNRRVKEFGETALGDNYLRVRFEDICMNSEHETRRIIEFLGGPMEQLAEIAAIVRTPRSIGRWKTFDKEQVDPVVSDGEEYLREFGYV